MQRYRTADALSRWVGDELLVLSLETQEYFSLGGTGGQILQLIGSGASSAEDLAKQISKEFDTEDSEILRDVEGFLSELLKAGLVVTVD